MVVWTECYKFVFGPAKMKDSFSVTPKRKLGSLSKDDCDGNENGFRLAKQQL